MVVGSMQRFVHVTDEVQQELQRYDLLFEVSGRVCKLRSKALTLVDHTIVGGAIGGRGSGRGFREHFEKCYIIASYASDAGFAEALWNFPAIHSARRHMHLEIRGSPFAILP